MKLHLYECSECGCKLRKRECILHDDPMAPLGPELLCPRCSGLVKPRHPPLLIALFTLLVIAFVVGLVAFNTRP